MNSESQTKQNEEEPLKQENQQQNSLNQEEAFLNQHQQVSEPKNEQSIDQNSLKLIQDEQEEEEKSSSINNINKNDQQKYKDEDCQDLNEDDYEDLEVDEEERKENTSTQNSINQEGPSIKTIPSLFPNTNIMQIRDQNQGTEFNKPFEDLNELINQLKTKQKYQKWNHEFDEVISQLNQSKRLLTDMQQPSQDRTLRESNLDYILEQITIIRSQFDGVNFETRNLPDEDDVDKNNLNKIDEHLGCIIQIVIKYQQQRINQMNSFISSAPLSNSLYQNTSNQQQAHSQNSNNNNGNVNRNQNNNSNLQNNGQGNNQNNQIPNNNIPNMNNQQLQQQQGQRQNIGQQQDIRVVRTYSMSLDLQIFQQLVDLYQKLIDHFDLILKSIIIFSCALFMISFSAVQQSYIQKPCDDQFVAFMKYLINQTASGFQSRVLVLNTIILSSVSMIFIWRSLWKYIVGSFTNDQRVRVKENLFRFCVFKHLIIMKALDDKIWTCNFDVLVIFVVYMQADISRFFSDITELTIKNILSNMSEDYDQEIQKISSIKNFNTLLTVFNFLTIIIYLAVFQSIPKLILLRLLFGLVVAFIWNIRSQMICSRLINQNGIQYYVNFNSDIIQEPTLQIEQQTNFILYNLKLGYLFYLVILFFDYSNIQLFWSFFIFYYFVFTIPSTLRKIALVVQSSRNTTYFQKNIDEIFPKLEINENNKDDFCTICHDQLLVGRRLKDCSHAFHLKCLFQWIKTQPQPRCPNCRVEIRNASQISQAFHPQPQNVQNNLNQAFNVGGQFTFQQVNLNQGLNAGINIQQANPQNAQI